MKAGVAKHGCRSPRYNVMMDSCRIHDYIVYNLLHFGQKTLVTLVGGLINLLVYILTDAMTIPIDFRTEITGVTSDKLN
jgi:hypothetical protein